MFGFRGILYHLRRSQDSSRSWPSHSPEAIADRLQQGPKKAYLKDFIYGAVDGAITTFAVVSGVAGAQLSVGIVIILGLCNLFADGFSMAVSNFLGTRAENQQRDAIRSDEHWEINHHPEGEKEEIRQIFARKGFAGEQLESIVDVITSDHERWVDTMVQEEHGLSLYPHSPFWSGFATFIAFFLVGAIPLVSFFINWWQPSTLSDPFLVSTVLTGLAFFIVGALKGQFVDQAWYWSAVETFLVGALAAGMAFGVGILLKDIIPV